MKTSDEVRQFTVEADDDGIRVDRWFKRHLPQVGFGTVSKWARTGQVRVDGKRVKPDDRLEQGQQIRVPPGGDAAHEGQEARVLVARERARGGAGRRHVLGLQGHEAPPGAAATSRS